MELMTMLVELFTLIVIYPLAIIHTVAVLTVGLYAMIVWPVLWIISALGR